MSKKKKNTFRGEHPSKESLNPGKRRISADSPPGAVGKKGEGRHRESWFRKSARRLHERKPFVPEPLIPFSSSLISGTHWISLGILIVSFLFAYWPTLLWLENAWRREPDYSHGYIVVPLCLILLYVRRGEFPGICRGIDWRGSVLIVSAIAMRILGRLAYMDFLDGWSIVPMVGGLIWLCFGWPAFRWSIPAVLFLLMLVPLPFRFETLLSWKLQGIATHLSTAMLRTCGQPAISEGHTIWIGNDHLMIEEACSGLRTFVGVAALAFFWAATVRRSWIDSVVILFATLPIALGANALRITATGLLYGWFMSPAARQIVHDWTGYLMIPISALLLWVVKEYWERLYRPLDVHSPTQRIRKPSLETPA